MQRKPSTIRIIIFDVGGVLCRDIEKHMMRDIAKKYKLSYKEVMKIRGKWWQLYATDTISEKEYWQGFLQDSGIREDWSKFRTLPYKRYIIPIKSMLPILQKLHKRYVLYILSDHAREWFAYAQKQEDFSSYFQGMFFSYEYKSLKEEKKLFQKALEEIKCRPTEILFVDNSKRNIALAKEYGMETILFTRVKLFEKELWRRNILGKE